MSNSDVHFLKLPISVELWSRVGVQGMTQGQMTAQGNSTCTPYKWRGFGGLVVSMLTSGTQHCEFEPDRSRRRGSKAVCPMSQICGM
jgi:hypothetical protein